MLSRIKKLSHKVKKYYRYETFTVLGPNLLHYIKRPRQLTAGFKYFYHHHLTDLLINEEYAQWQKCDFDPAEMRFRYNHRWIKPNVWEKDMDPAIIDTLDRPVILLAKGGGGSRVLALAAQDCGIFIGNTLNSSKDTMEMALAVYQGILRKSRINDASVRTLTTSHLRRAAAEMLKKNPTQYLWGFKLPESLLLLPEIDAAFPNARYLYMFPDAQLTCLRQPHLTAQTEHELGRVCLQQAYAAAGINPEQFKDDPSQIRMAYTTRHQIDISTAFCRSRLDRSYECRFQDIVHNPAHELGKMAAWLGVKQTGGQLLHAVDTSRARKKIEVDPEIKKQVFSILEALPESIHPDASSTK